MSSYNKNSEANVYFLPFTRTGSFGLWKDLQLLENARIDVVYFELNHLQLAIRR